MSGESHEERLDQLLESFFEELRSMPDAEVLAGESPELIQARNKDRLARALREAGRRRMAAARIQAVHVNKAPVKPVSVQEARDYIARVAQDRKYTLAARQLEEMPDADILRLYEQLRELEAQDPGEPGPAR
jgi:hypothetical protein